MSDMRATRARRMADGTRVRSWPWNSSPLLRTAVVWLLMMATLYVSAGLWSSMVDRELQTWTTDRSTANDLTGMVSATLWRCWACVALPLVGFGLGTLAVQSSWQTRWAGQLVGAREEKLAGPGPWARCGLSLWHMIAALITVGSGAWIAIHVTLPLFTVGAEEPWRVTVARGGRAGWQMGVAWGLVMLSLGCIDVVFRAWGLRRDDERNSTAARDERRESEGHPTTRQRQRNLRRK